MKGKALAAHALLGIAAAWSVLSCSPTYAPPARATHYGAPPSPRKGAYEVAGSILAESTPEGGGGAIHYAVSDRIQLETGADGYADRFVMGHAGVRYAPLSGLWPDRLVRFTFDVEGGLAIGLGGENCSRKNANGDPVCDRLSWDERLAGGGYAGVGLGLSVAWFDLYVRGRVQPTYADRAPETLWISGVVGAQATVFKRAKIYLAGGRYLYVNEWDSQNATIWEAGLSFFFRPK